MSLADGAVFAGYTVIRLLGAGGMGEVYLAQHPRLPRQDALKVLPISVSADPEFRARFEREADLAGALWHPHIVGVHDRGEDDGRLWIAMDYVEGTDASRLVRDQYQQGMPPTEVIEIVQAVGQALDYAHERQLLHRDVKPANILLTYGAAGNRRILLADFGIARHTDDAVGLTATNVAIGSVHYAAPEQLMGEPIDGRADQYALAATAFHLLTGTAPFGNSNAAAVISRHLNNTRPTVLDTHPELTDLDSVLQRALAKSPADRYNSCGQFAAALAERGARSAALPTAVSVTTPADALPTQISTRSAPPTAHGAPTAVRSNWATTEPARPRPHRGNNLKWGLIAVGILAAVVAIALVVVVFFGGNAAKNTPAAGTTTPNAGAQAASAQDTGAVTVITEDSTCTGWNQIHSEGSTFDEKLTERDASLPASEWNDQQRAQFTAFAAVLRTNAGKTVTLAATTPHRVMRELYEQFMAYANAYVLRIPKYTPADDNLLSTAESAANALSAICAAISDGTAALRGPLVQPPPAPSNPAKPGNVKNPQPYLLSANPVCGEWNSTREQFVTDTAAWAEVDAKLPAHFWNAEQKAVNLAVAKVMQANAQKLQQLGRKSGNPILQDFADLAAQYRQAFAAAIPTYSPSDINLHGAATYLSLLIQDACTAVQGG